MHTKLLRSEKNRGFTLVELSIVLVIIALLIGGILVGQSLIESVKLKKLLSDIVAMEIVTTNFYQKYKSLPGESKGFLRVGGVVDGRISTDEYRQSFKHLALAGMIPERNKTIDIAQTGYNFATPHNAKTTMMPSSFDGVGINYGYTLWTGFSFVQWDGTSYIWGAGATDRKQGNFFQISKVKEDDVDARTHTGHYMGDYFLTQSLAKSLDKKMDDGHGRAGKLFGYGSSYCTSGYNETNWGQSSFDKEWRKWIHPDGAATPVCGLLYWYDYK